MRLEPSGFGISVDGDDLHIGSRKLANITKSDIEHGTRSDCEDCPLALAALRLFPGRGLLASGEYVSVYEIDENEDLIKYLHSWRHDAGNFVTEFDAGNAVSPRKVLLELTEMGTL